MSAFERGDLTHHALDFNISSLSIVQIWINRTAAHHLIVITESVHLFAALVVCLLGFVIELALLYELRRLFEMTCSLACQHIHLTIIQIFETLVQSLLRDHLSDFWKVARVPTVATTILEHWFDIFIKKVRMHKLFVLNFSCSEADHCPLRLWSLALRLTLIVQELALIDVFDLCWLINYVLTRSWLTWLQLVSIILTYPVLIVDRLIQLFFLLFLLKIAFGWLPTVLRRLLVRPIRLVSSGWWFLASIANVKEGPFDLAWWVSVLGCALINLPWQVDNFVVFACVHPLVFLLFFDWLLGLRIRYPIWRSLALA